MPDHTPTTAHRLADAGERSEVALFDRLYAEHFAFVYRTLFRLGVPSAAIDDAAQDTFLVVLRHLARFEGGTSERAWLFSITRRVAADHRRATARRRIRGPLDETRFAAEATPPEDVMARKEAWAFVERFLSTLNDSRRFVFILGELEQLPVPEIAEALDLNINTAYAQLRAVRQAFHRAWKRAQLKKPGADSG